MNTKTKIREVTENKKAFLDLLLLADEQEDMIDRYLERGRMFVLEDESGKVFGECVVTDEGGGVLEIKNIATSPEVHGKGYGKALIQYVEKAFSGKFSVLQVGTGDSPLTVPFYEKCGFTRHHVEKDFFTKNYDHPIFEAGVQLVDMVYLRKKIVSEKKMTELRELNDSNFDEMKALFKSVFMGPPWNDDWSDDNQLTEYLLDLTKVRNPIRLGLYENGELVGISIGEIHHWWGGTEYYIQELCIKTDMQGKGLGSKFITMIEDYVKARGLKQIFLQTERNVPAYEFYKKRGFEELTDHVSFFKDFKK